MLSKSSSSFLTSPRAKNRYEPTEEVKKATQKGHAGLPQKASSNST